jgi:hypothetical protein
MGFAPNPFFGVCSLAACKPVIRKNAQIGDVIIGTGAAKRKLTGHLIYWMKVSETADFDEYWRSKKHVFKRPDMSGSLKRRFGDNIYAKNNEGEYEQKYSFHSRRDGSLQEENLLDDVGKTDRILLADEFCYFGKSGPKMPSQLTGFVRKGRNHLRFSGGQERPLLDWLATLNRSGFVDEPVEWKYARRRARLGR